LRAACCIRRAVFARGAAHGAKLDSKVGQRALVRIFRVTITSTITSLLSKGKLHEFARRAAQQNANRM
jgi:hypothetical protein